MGGDQPLAVDLFEHDQNTAVHRDSGVGGLVDSSGVTEVPGAEDGEGLDEVDVTAGGPAGLAWGFFIGSAAATSETAKPTMAKAIIACFMMAPDIAGQVAFRSSAVFPWPGGVAVGRNATGYSRVMTECNTL